MRFLSLVLLSIGLLGAANTLDIYFVDVEGGQSTLFVSPSGESMMVDSGFPGNNNRDADRIAAAAKLAGIKQIDYFVATHYHLDHIGGVPQLAAKLPIRAFVDHGATFESDSNPEFVAYKAARAKGKHLLVKPGDKVPVKGLDVVVLTAAGNKIASPLKGAGAANPLCSGAKQMQEDKSENARSVGTLITFGKFRIIDLGDLTWNKELELACPNNLVGTIDVYLTTHHGADSSGPPQIVHALAPRVIVMNNGARKGGAAPAMAVMKGSPGVEDIWQGHNSIDAAQANAAEKFVANPEENCQGHWVKVSAKRDGEFTVTNGRNGFTKTYKAR